LNSEFLDFFCGSNVRKTELSALQKNHAEKPMTLVYWQSFENVKRQFKNDFKYILIHYTYAG